MANKRLRTQDPGEDGDDDLGHAGVREVIARNRPHKRLRRETPKSQPSTSVNHLKGKIRDVTRTLERSKNLPADIRVEKERALAAYKLDLEEAEAERTKQRMIKKYHMVRFFG